MSGLDNKNWKRKVKWSRFYQRIIDTKGNPSLQDARECNMPDGIFNEICMRTLTPELLVKIARENIDTAKEWEEKHAERND